MVYRRLLILLIAIPNLDVIETVDSEKLAASIDRSWGSIRGDNKLKVFIQINTSQEESE